MTGTIKFFHPEETLIYHIKKSFCKVVFQNMTSVLVVEIQSTDELHHVAEDSIQNEFPEINLTIEDVIISQTNLEELINSTIEIPNSYEEKENQEGELEEFFYTNLNVNDELDVELNQNTLKFSKNDKNQLQLQWKGFADDFTNFDLDKIPFEVNCIFIKETEEEEEV